MGKGRSDPAAEAFGGPAFTVAQEGFVVIDEAGTILQINPAAERIFGYQRDELVGQPIGRLIADGAEPPFEVRHFHSRARLRARHEPFEASLAVTFQDEYRLVSVLPLADGGKAERHLAMIAEGMPDSFALWDPDSCLVLCNGRFRELYAGVADIITPGLPLERFLRELVTRGVFLLDPLDTIEDWVAARLARHREQRLTTDDPLADGRWLRVHRYRTDDGHVVAIQSDISHFKRREELLIEKEAFYRSFADELIAARERLKEQTSRLATLAETQYAARERAEAASLAKSQFLAAMSHELRTPLNAILGFSEMLRMEAFGPLGADKYREYSADIHTSGRHLLALINDVLDMSKIEAGKYELNLEDCTLDTLIAESVRIVEGRAQEAGVRVFSGMPKVAMPVRADPRAVKQCLINLLGNAVKFTPRGGSVKVEAEVDAAYARVRVSDTGIGIPDEDLPHITEPFVQSKRSREHWSEGTGLGLALTKSLVEMHHGSLAIRSAVGRGTIVTLTLPVGGPAGPAEKPNRFERRRLGAQP